MEKTAIGPLVVLFLSTSGYYVAASPEIPVWTPFEYVLESDVVYPQPKPWWGIELNATFANVAANLSLETPGFWDGNTTWKVRFSPPTPGLWTFTTTCSDGGNKGLHRNGSFLAIPYNGTNPLFKHGVIRPHGSGRYFVHDDGTPFYWLGDTHWSGFSSAEHWSDTDNATVDPGGPASMLKEMVDVRARQGYSVWKAETFVINGQQGGKHDSITNAGGPAWEGAMFSSLNPSFWAAMDAIASYVNGRGLLLSLAFAGIGRGLTSPDLEAPITALARYAVARYAAYHTVWTTCQEYCAGTEYPEAWGRIARSQYYLDPHRRSTSLHNCASNPIPEWRGEEWYGHVTLQQGHFSTRPVDYWLEHYHASPPRVVVEDEANYELLKYASMTANVPGWLARQSAWQAQVAGATGYTYGGQGIWWACFNRTYRNSNCGPNDPPGLPPHLSGYYTWDQALYFPVGGTQLPFMADFWRALPWHTLHPDDNAIAWSPLAPSDTQRPFQKADDNRDHIVAYLPQLNGNPHGQSCRPPLAPHAYNGTLLSIGEEQAHELSWFNPRTGESDIIAMLPVGTKQWPVPASRPNPEEADLDWVLLLQPLLDDKQHTRPHSHTHTRPRTHTHTRPNRFLNSKHFSNMSVEIEVTPPSTPPGTSWVASVTSLGRVRNSAVTNGCTFVTTQGVRVTHLCRLPTQGARNVQKVLVTSTNGTVLARVAVDALHPPFTDALGFMCSTIAPDPVSLIQGHTYVLLAETSGCDGWRDDMHTVVEVEGGDNAQVTSVYGMPPDLTPGGGGHNHCYGPLNFYFQ